jgi:murein DD-endopeptidase MepM/ murein hydrolase activator NlpD
LKLPHPPAVAVLAIVGWSAASSAAHAQSGGLEAPAPPTVRSVTCLAGAGVSCGAPSTVFQGQQFVVRGASLQLVARIVFRGGRRRSDDAVARVTRATRRYAVASVPDSARTGRLMLISRYGTRSLTPGPVRVRPAPRPPAIDIAPASRFFYAGRRRATFGFDSQRSTQAEIQLVSEDRGTVVKSWSLPVQAGQHVDLSWDGRGPQGVERTGSYRFELVGEAGSAAAASPDSDQRFFFADHLFPIRGRHNLGYTDTNNFGGGRGHKGQDMFARCGTQLAAARGGIVQYAGYHSAAGYYAVIDGADTGVDYVYMHMRKPAAVAAGERVFTGQAIGEVGETGRATGCHLHFEMWSAPGWYEGGRAFDPLPSLREWDGYS